MDDAEARGTGALAVTVGVVGVCSMVSLATYFAVGGPFGTLNDIGNGITGVLGAALAWRLRSHLPGQARPVGLSAAIGGGALAVVGSALVVSGATGFFLAGLVSSVGFAGIGTWLLLFTRSDHAAGWPRGVRSLGLAAGTLMALGLAAAPGILLGLDDMATAPGWVWLGLVGWLGIYVLYPVWAIRFGLVERRRPVDARTSASAGAAREASEVRSWTGG